MPGNNGGGEYVIVTPVRNEAGHIARTLESVTRQTVRPRRWIIVDDGSSDGTCSIVETYRRRFGWIRLVKREDRGFRQVGSGVVDAFHFGFGYLDDADWRYIVKLDGDLELPTDYFEFLLGKFREIPALGIASGVYLERRDRGWKEVPMPSYHAAGASKVYRRETFESIGGLVSRQGWDTADEIKAMHRGWVTMHFREARFRHLKDEGSGLGQNYTNRFHGRIYYLTGGGPLFFLVKTLRRMVVGKPPVIAGVMLAFGYIQAAVSGQERLVTEEERRFYRGLLNRRIRHSLLRLFGSD
jgi:glycosyltransferase involved in cell wall biosynthesis